MSQDNEFFTVVFKGKPDSTFKKEILKHFKDSTLIGDVQITAVSLTDEISRVEIFEEEGFECPVCKNITN